MGRPVTQPAKPSIKFIGFDYSKHKIIVIYNSHIVNPLATACDTGYTNLATEKEVVGIRSPLSGGDEPLHTHKRLFYCLDALIYGQSGQGAARLAGATPGLLTCSVLLTRLEAGVQSRNLNIRSSIMNALATIALGTSTIRQHNGLYSLNDFHKAGGEENKHRPKYWLENQQTKDLVAEISKGGIPPILAKQGLGTYACRELVIAYAAWISPAFHLKVIRVFLDSQLPKPKQIGSGLKTAITEAVTMTVLCVIATFGANTDTSVSSILLHSSRENVSMSWFSRSSLKRIPVGAEIL